MVFPSTGISTSRMLCAIDCSQIHTFLPTYGNNIVCIYLVTLAEKNCSPEAHTLSLTFWHYCTKITIVFCIPFPCLRHRQHTSASCTVQKPQCIIGTGPQKLPFFGLSQVFSMRNNLSSMEYSQVEKTTG